MRKMFEWDSKAKTLSHGERNYIADYAWGLKKITTFHEENIKKHLTRLLRNGFKI
jgi:hypothetical protein